MLAPRHRSLLLESLRPPTGYRLGRAVATTYTLDLLALLTAPLAFTFFDWEDVDGRPSSNPLALLEAVRRHARKLHVFCQGGAMAVPRHGQVLLAHLEPCVVEVAAPRGGVFHPKVWVLRFDPEAEGPVRFRLLVGTRNLTFDRSWDTQLQLEGELSAGGAPIAANRPLAAFVAALPGLALQDPPAEARAAATELADELLHVEWELPEKVEEIEFLPMGIGDSPWPFSIGRQRLVMAPFLDARFLERFGRDREDGVVVSSSESLQGAEAGLGPFAERFTLADGAEDEQPLELEGEEGQASENEDDGALGPDADRLRGLHAKLFVIDDGWRTQIFTGSANGTMAAFERNVEFMVRLDASKSAMGIEALLGREEKGALFDLLEPWEATEVEDDPEQELIQRLEKAIEGVQRGVAEADLWLEVQPAPTRAAAGRREARGDGRDGAGEEDAAFRLQVHGDCPAMPRGIQLRVWPVVMPPMAAVAPAGEQPLASFDVSLGAVTAFLAFEVVAQEAGVERRTRFARRLRIEGLPADRDERILRSLLKDRATVTRLLYLLLSPEEVSTETLANLVTGEGGGSGWRGQEFGLPLFEPLITTLARGPEALAAVERLVADLSRSEEGRALLPEDFEALFGAVRAAREELSE
ncbi:hypothetical protein OAF73_01030 [Planctomycetota bacterium]|nr:hypothetical protein [Planctomycetota bacterium]